jgi:hypothetical protein
MRRGKINESCIYLCLIMLKYAKTARSDDTSPAIKFSCKMRPVALKFRYIFNNKNRPIEVVTDIVNPSSTVSGRFLGLRVASLE